MLDCKTWHRNLIDESFADESMLQWYGQGGHLINHGFTHVCHH